MEVHNTLCEQCWLRPVNRRDCIMQYDAEYFVGFDNTTMKVCEYHKNVFDRYIKKFIGHVRWKGDVLFHIGRL